MPAEIDVSVNAKGAAIFALEPAWHGAGTVFDHEFTKEEALAYEGINFIVEKQRLGFFSEKEGRWMEFPDNFATVRMDTNVPLGTVKKNYRVVQNWESFYGMDKILADYGAKYVAAGVLRGGKKFWILAKLPVSFQVTEAKGDQIDEYLLLATTHDGTGAIWCLPTGVRVVCMNTLSAALGYNASIAKTKAKAGKAVRIRHAANATQRLEEAKGVFEEAHKRMLDNIEQAKRLVEIPANEEMITDYTKLALDEFIGPERVVNPDGSVTLFQKRAERRRANEKRILDTIINETQLVGSNAWAVYNGITAYVDHGIMYRGKYAAENRFQDVLYGDADDFKRSVMESMIGKHVLSNLITMA